MEPTKPNPPPAKRRWPQYRLRTLLLAMLLASIGLSWFAVKVAQARKQRTAVDVVLQLRGQVEYYPVFGGDPRTSVPAWLLHTLGEDFFASVAVVDLSRTRLADRDLEHLAEHLQRLPRLWELDLAGTQIGNAGFEYLKDLTQLRSLDLIGTQVTDAGLIQLRDLPHLQLLSLNDTQVGDAGLAHLPGLKELRVLNLGGTKVSDAGLAHLVPFTQLRYLDLADTPITDAGLEHLKQLTQLQSVKLRRTKVTDDAVKQFQQALPKCEILR